MSYKKRKRNNQPPKPTSVTIEFPDTHSLEDFYTWFANLNGETLFLQYLENYNLAELKCNFTRPDRIKYVFRD